jgi:hypothetical protein
MATLYKPAAGTTVTDIKTGKTEVASGNTKYNADLFSFSDGGGGSTAPKTTAPSIAPSPAPASQPLAPAAPSTPSGTFYIESGTGAQVSASQMKPGVTYTESGTGKTVTGGATAAAPKTSTTATTAPKPVTPTQPASTVSPQQTGAEAQQVATQIKPTGSVVDTLSLAGQDSSFAARQQLAAQYGIQNYSGTASQNQELERKFVEAYNQLKGQSAPQTPAEARGALDSYFDEAETDVKTDPIRGFMDAFGAMNPVESQIFSQLSQLMDTNNTQQSLREVYEEEVAAQGLPALNMELADINRIMDGTEDDIRAEITNAGGFATESQVQALVGARNKVLLRKANYLTNVINSKNDYVKNIVALTEADQKMVSEELDRKLGITKMMFDMAQTMQKNARENYTNLIKDVGYDGLVQSITSPQELTAVASALGMSPKTLLGLSKVQTSDQRKLAIDEMNFQLSVDKFNEDKRQFGMSYALEQQKVALQKAATSTLSPYQQRNSQLIIDEIDSLLPRVGNDTVGIGSLSGYIPGTKARDFSADVDELLSGVFKTELNAMREASKTGGAVGNVSDKEGSRLANSIGALEDRGQSPENYKKNLLEAKDAIYSWNGQLMAFEKGFDYNKAKNSVNPQTGKNFTSEDIYKYLISSE